MMSRLLDGAVGASRIELPAYNIRHWVAKMYVTKAKDRPVRLLEQLTKCLTLVFRFLQSGAQRIGGHRSQRLFAMESSSTE
jgi:hypothetical protein